MSLTFIIFHCNFSLLMYPIFLDLMQFLATVAFTLQINVLKKISIITKKERKILMKKFSLKRIAMMAMATMMAASAMSVSAFAAADHEAKTVDPDIQVVAIDENGNETIIPLFYDEEAAALSEQMSKQRASYSTWDLAYNNYTEGINWSSSMYNIPYAFRTSSGKIAIDSVLYGLNNVLTTPSVAVNNYTTEQSGLNGYVGSFNYEKIGTGTYDLEYTVRGLSSSNKYRFSIMGNGNWSNGNISLRNG